MISTTSKTTNGNGKREYEDISSNQIHVGIVGGGIGGLALAIALRKNNIHSTIFEKDASFLARKQGYGLTLQQAGRAVKHLAADIQKYGETSSSHFIFDAKGKISLFWGTSAHIDAAEWNHSKNCHVSRQALRKILLDSLDPDFSTIKWSSPVTTIQRFDDYAVIQTPSASHRFDLVCAADGIHSNIRASVDSKTLNSLHSFVILGIFTPSHPIYKHRIIQMSDGKARIYLMPFEKGTYMWQLSCLGPCSPPFKEFALEICKDFHGIVLDAIRSTDSDVVTGYPVFDRDPLTEPFGLNRLTFLGDAAHPMSPFKGQGANQALIDAISLAKELGKPDVSINDALLAYELEMIARTSPKIIASRNAIDELHCVDFCTIDYQLKRRGYASGVYERVKELLLKLSSQGYGIWSTQQELLQACIDQNEIFREFAKK